MKKINRVTGFSLIELMIVIGLLGGLSLVVMNLTKQSTKSSVKYDFDSDKTQITNELTGILSDPNKCNAANALLGKNAASDTTITSIGTQYYSLVSTTPAPPANGYGNAGINIASYSLSATAADIAANTSYLVVNFKGKNILGVQGLKTSKIKLNVTLDGSGNILACNAVGSGSGSLQWTTLANDIFNSNSGNVGIGTSNPLTKLDVSGAIKIAFDPTPCTGANEGTQRYNPTNKNMEFCNGLVWASTGGGTSGTVCGFSGRTFNLVSSTWANFTSLCQGFNPLTNCPPGFTRYITPGYGSTHFNAAWCTKD